jgi:peroxiredoxin
MDKCIATLVFALMLAGPALAHDVGDQAPSFAAPSLVGSEKLSLSQYKGKIVYLDFWASWCPPCLKSLPLLEELRVEFAGKNIQFLAINLDRDLDKARAFLASHPVNYPSASDPEGRLPETFEVKTMPTSFLIDARGVIRYIHEGFRDGDIEEIRAQIQKLVGATK